MKVTITRQRQPLNADALQPTVCFHCLSSRYLMNVQAYTEFAIHTNDIAAQNTSYTTNQWEVRVFRRESAVTVTITVTRAGAGAGC
jgi:hypothetical protein